MSTPLALMISLLLLAGNAFFVGAEFALISARRSVIELRADEGGWAARITLHAMERVALMMAGAQLGITLCTLGLGALAGAAAFLIANVIQDLLGRRVGGPNAAETATMITVMLISNICAALAMTAAIARGLRAARAE